MEIPIEFDTGSGNNRFVAFILGMFFAPLALINIVSIDQLIRCHHYILRSRFPNLTSADSNLSCNVYYDDCVCSVDSTNSLRSTYCLSAFQFILSRISTPIIFISFCLLLWHTFSFSKNCPRVFVLFSRILFLLILIGITIGVYWNTCYHYCIVICLFGTLLVLLFTFLFSLNILTTPPYAKSRFISTKRANFSRST